MKKTKLCMIDFFSLWEPCVNSANQLDRNTSKPRLSQVECLVYFTFHAPLHAPLFHCQVTLWGALGRSEKSGGEVHSVGMATDSGGNPSRLEIKTLSFWDTWNKRDLTVGIKLATNRLRKVNACTGKWKRGEYKPTPGCIKLATNRLRKVNACTGKWKRGEYKPTPGCVKLVLAGWYTFVQDPINSKFTKYHWIGSSAYKNTQVSRSYLSIFICSYCRIRKI